MSKVRGHFLASIAGGPGRLSGCQDIQVNRQGNLVLMLDGPENNLHIEMEISLAREIIDFLAHGCRVKLGVVKPGAKP